MRSISERIDYFIPDELGEEDQQVAYRRAQIAVKTAIFLTFWGPVAAAFSHWRIGSVPITASILGVTVIVAMAPLVLRWTSSMTVAGNVILVPFFMVATVLGAISGGIVGASTSWLLMLPLLAMLFQGMRAAAIWLGVVLATWGGLFTMDIMGISFAQPFGDDLTEVRRMLEIVVLGTVIFSMMVQKDRMQNWLVNKVKAKEAKTRAVLETAPDGILTIDAEGLVVSANPAAGSIFSRLPESIIGRGLQEFVPSLPPQELMAWADEKPRSARSGEYVGVRLDQEFPLEISLGRLPEEEDGQEQVVLVMRDITERKRDEEEIRRARDEAVEANRAKSVFLANMSHELRTPLNAVIGYSEMMLEEIESANDEGSMPPASEFEPDLQRVHRAGRHLLALINDILDLSKIEARRMTVHLEMIDVRELFDDIAGTIGPLAKKNENQVTITVDDNVGFIRSDATKVRQILFNLVSNACKFTSQGTVALHASSDTEQGQLVCEVRDTGIGMNQEQLESVFDAFVQADSSTTRAFGGTGLGLTITKHFCELLGGELEVESTPGEGTTFRVRLDSGLDVEDSFVMGLGDEVSVVELDSFEETIDGDAPLVLVVDDDEMVRDLLVRTLEGDGFEVVTATNGAEGLALATELKPVVITLDVMMPNVDGWTLLRRLKEDRELAQIPVIMVTMVTDVGRGYALGADDYLVKPVERRKLLETVQKVAGGAGKAGRALVVEDDEPTRELLRRMMEDDGWEVEEAEDGGRGIERAKEVLPHVVLLDLMMPGVDGFEFLRRFRQCHQFEDTPVLVVTAKELTAEEQFRLKTEANRVIAKKGIDRERLLREVRRQVGQIVENEASLET